MNAFNAHNPNLQPRLALAAPARREPPSRDFGTGYGRSSGYAKARSYAQDQSLPRFRFG